MGMGVGVGGGRRGWRASEKWKAKSEKRASRHTTREEKEAL
jgi:hypothetical protein